MKPEQFTFFWNGQFSQWYPSEFKVDGVNYNCAEQYMMAGKANYFEDYATLKKIMETASPKIQKQLGRNVSNFDVSEWSSIAKLIVYKGNHAKFTQNRTLLKSLMDTKGTTLVEASPYDKVWGIGLREKDPKALDRNTWNGMNWLGETLTKLRNDLMTK